MVTLARLKELFSYEPVTGRFVRLLTTNPRATAGSSPSSKPGRRLVIQIDGQKYEAGRLAWLYVTGGWPEDVVDHRDHDPSNTRWTNLRDVTQAINLQNQPRERPTNRSSGLLGATMHKPSGKWMAQIKLNGKTDYLGYFDTAEGAHLAYVARKREIHIGGLL